MGVGAGDLSPAACLPSETPGVGADGAVSYGPPGPRHPPQCCCSVWAAGAPHPNVARASGAPRPSQGLVHAGPTQVSAHRGAAPLPRLPFISPGRRGPTKDPHTLLAPRLVGRWRSVCFPLPLGGSHSTIPTGFFLLVALHATGHHAAAPSSPGPASVHTAGAQYMFREQTGGRSAAGAPELTLPPPGGRSPLSSLLMGCQRARGGEGRGR